MPPKVVMHASHQGYTVLLQPSLESVGIELTDKFEHGVARVLLDYPLTYALRELNNLSSFERSHTLVCTQAKHEVYLDCLASFHTATVTNTFNNYGVIAGLHSAASAQRHYSYRSGLTYMELRVTRLLLLAVAKDELASRLSITSKTVNAHVSNILTKLGHESRSQYVATLLNSGASPDDYEHGSL